jgi:hypothetical protein
MKQIRLYFISIGPDSVMTIAAGNENEAKNYAISKIDLDGTEEQNDAVVKSVNVVGSYKSTKPCLLGISAGNNVQFLWQTGNVSE